MANNLIDIVVQLTDKNTEAGLKKITASAEGAKSALGKMKNDLMAIGAGVGVVGIGAKLAKEAIQWDVAVKKLSGITGATAKETSELLAVANYMGVAMEDSAGAFAKFSKNVGAAKEKMEVARAEGKLGTDIFSKLGYTLEQIQGKNTVEVFKMIQERLRGMKDGAEKTRVEMELFGRTGYQMHAMLNMSAEQMDKVAERAKAMGLIIDDDTAAKSAKLNRELKDLENTGKRLAVSIGHELVPVFNDYAKEILGAAKRFEAMTAEQKGAIASIVKFGVEAGTAITIIRSATTALGFMKLATIAAAGPWVALAAAIGLAGKALINYAWTAKSAKYDTGVTTSAGYKAYEGGRNGVAGRDKDIITHRGRRVKNKLRDAKYIVDDGILFPSPRAATAQEIKEIEAAKKAKADLEESQKKAEAAQKEMQDKLDDLANGGLTNTEAINKANEEAAKAAKAQEQAAKKAQQAAEKLTSAVERMADLYRSLTLQSLQIDGSQYEIDKLTAKNQYEANNKNIRDIIRSVSGVNSGAIGQAAGVLDAANEQLGKAYKLGADGTWATDCGKLFSDAVKQSLGADVPRRVDKLWQAAAAVGAWHPEGDGYIPKAGDGVVVLGDEHIVISDGNGGYTGANTNGVVAKPSVTADFGAITGYIDTAKYAGAASSATADSVGSAENAKKLAESDLTASVRAKNEELYQKRLAEAQRNQTIRVRKMNEDIKKLDLERTGDRLQLLKAEAEAQKAQIDDNVREYTKAVGDKELAEKKAQAERLKVASDTEQKIRELAYTQTSETVDHLTNMVALGRLSRSDADALLAEELKTYIDYARSEVNEAQLTATQRLQIEKNLLESQQKLWELAGRSLKTSLQEAARQYKQETTNYADLAKSTFDSTMSSINSAWTNNLEAMATGTKSFSKGIKDIFKDMTNAIIKMMIQLTFQQYVMPKLQGLFGGAVSGIGSLGAAKGTSSFASGGSFSSAFTGNRFAAGGKTNPGLMLVGENGPELLQSSGSHRIYTASETRRLMGGATSNNVVVNIVNQSGQELESKQQNSRFDGENYVIDVVVRAMGSNKGGVRDAIRAAAT
ncbi:MAG: phage tail tape measure C-terminal domain-containing protein [Veillonella sp.]|uniref:phage tail tape measure C-terminal domain-containing protein n=1 Tax=Veillonella sp. TaxID=1926307 RepID=UPI00290ADECD|nr:phage tail tape measure C-terminal domain-containing protein [Veillonella sp.]MDU7910073.1 phage tail tape measure C-terminal domain-containing protein [Veillonella parvula]MDU7927903.1 phage tail tape measure C-terminal domain-containing protein [Veillonella sp.]MDU8007364.1 phage tail tape measure C-terminal domain-containing protein [Veillonella sp.]